MDDSAPQPGKSNLKVRPDDARGTPPGAGTVTPQHGGRIGNPPFVATDEMRAKARSLAKAFPPTAERMIARLMGIGYDTLKRHLQDELEHGRAELIASVAAQEIALALDADTKVAKGDPHARRFLLSKLGGWNHKVEITGRDGGPIEHREVDLTKYSPKDLADYGRLAAIQAGIDPDTIIAVPTDG